MSQIPPPPQSPYPQQPYGQPPQGVPPAPTGGGYSLPPQRKTSGAAIASLVFGILGCVPFITGLLAVILGIVGIGKTKDPRYSGRGLAIAGLILGLLSIVLWGIFGGGAYAFYAYGKPAREASNQFLRDLSVANIEAAQAKSTSTLTRQQLQAAADKIKPWGVLQDTTLPVMAMNKTAGSETFEIGGWATFPNTQGQPVPYFVHMVKQGGEFKVDGFLLQHPNAAVTAGTTPQTNTRKTLGD